MMANYRNSRDDKSDKKKDSPKSSTRKPAAKRMDDSSKSRSFSKPREEGKSKFNESSKPERRPRISGKSERPDNFKPRVSRSADAAGFERKPKSFSKDERSGDFKPRTSRNADSAGFERKPKSFSKDERPSDFKPRVSRGDDSTRPERKPKSFSKDERTSDFKPRTSRNADSAGFERKPKSFSKDKPSSDFKPRTNRSNDTERPQKSTFPSKPFTKKYTSESGKPEGGKSFSKPFKKGFERPERNLDNSDSSEILGSDERRKSNSNENYSRPFTRTRAVDGRINKGGKGPAKPRDTSVGLNPKKAGEVRLNKYLSNAGVASRRKADELIIAGEVMVNDVVVTEMGYKVMPGDKVRFNGQLLKREKNVYILLNKPKDYITTTDDPQERKTVMELIKNATKERIYPVGRLDRNTTGLLLLTNDGELAMKLAHPKNNVTKLYHVFLDKNLKKVDFDKIEKGIELEDGLVKVDHLSYVEGAGKDEIGIELHSGKNRIVRRIFESLGYQVEKLDRSIYAGLTKKDLPRGKWRHLSEEEVVRLRHFKA